MTKEQIKINNELIHDYCKRHDALYAGASVGQATPYYDHSLHYCMCALDIIRRANYDVTIQMYDSCVNVAFYNTSIEHTEIASIGGERRLMDALYLGLVQFIKTVSK